MAKPGGASRRRPKPDRVMKVATWNLWWRLGEWNKRLPAIRNVLGATNPDICALQEVWLDGDRDQVRTLVEALVGRTVRIIRLLCSAT